MRSAIILVITVVVLGGGFAAYMWRQRPPSNAAQKITRQRSEASQKFLTDGPATTPANENLKVSAGENVFVETYDKKTGNLATRFRAARYDPRADGTVDTVQPEAEFYLNNGQVLHLRGTTGKVVVPASTPGSSGGGAMGRTQMPSRGLLHDVTLQMFAMRGAKRPTMTCRMNNASFDNETFSVATEAYVDERTGEHVAADQVQVQVRGDDYDFDGRGLTLHWDERDRKLQSLEIAHGKKLTLKRPKAMHIGPTTAPALSATSRPRAAVDRWDVLPVQLASADRGAIADVLTSALAAPPAKPTKRQPKRRGKGATLPVPTSAPTSKPRSLDLYRATFYDNVRVVQDRKEMAKADVLSVEFATLGKVRELTPEEAAATQAAATQPGAAMQPNGTDPAENSADAPPIPPIVLPAASSGARPTPAARKGAAAKGAGGKGSAKNAAAKGSTTSSSGTKSAEAATTVPASSTQPAESPITVYWTGPLRVEPFGESDVPDPPTSTNDTVIQMQAKTRPVLLDWQGSHVVCGMFRYHSADDSVSIQNSDVVPTITLKDPRGATVSAPGLDYSGVQHVADIPGPAFVELPVDATGNNPSAPAASATTSPTTAPTMARIDWTESCMLQLAGDSREQMNLSHAEFDGNVHVAHPQLQLLSQSMQVDFDPVDKAATRSIESKTADARPASNIAIRQLVATERVHTEIHDPAKPNAPAQSVDCEQLMVAFDAAPDGQTYPRTVTADGSVIAGDGESQLEASHLDATLAPSTQPVAQTNGEKKSTMPAVELKSLFAHTNVRGRSTDGRMLEAQQLEVASNGDGTMQYKLFGKPDAKLGTGTTTLVGPIITFEPGSGRADVIGAGSMHAVQESQRASRVNPQVALATAAAPTSQPTSRPTPRPSTQPIDVVWTDHMHADTLANKIEVFGGVHAVSTLSDGSRNTVDGAKLTMTLVDAPTTQPTKAPITRPARPGMLGATGGQNDAFKNKQIDIVTIDDPKNVIVESILNDLEGDLERRLHLRALTLDYNPTRKRLHIPVAGDMLYQDILPGSTTRPSTRASAQATSQPSTLPTTNPKTVIASTTKPSSPMSALSSTHGATAFQWQKDFTYDDTDHTVTMTGGVQVVHLLNDTNMVAYRLNAERLVAEMEGADGSTTKPTTRPAADTPMGGAKLKHLVADGGVIFIAQRLHFQSQSIDFNPITNQLVARGTDREPAQLFDDAGLSQGTFTELTYDVKTDRMKVTNFRAAIRK